MIKPKNVFGIVELGNSTITSVIARFNFGNNYEILSIANTKSCGYRNGVIIDIESFKDALISCLELAEKKVEMSVKKVFISLNSSFLISKISSSSVDLANHEITLKDLNKLLFKVIEKYNTNDNVDVIHTFPYEYILDGNKGIIQPLGLFGSRLQCYFHLISAPMNNIINITKCFEKCGLEVDSYISSSYASGLSCLTVDEMQEGATLIELGGGSTTVSNFSHNNIIFTEAVKYGGDNITSDIAKVLSISFDAAEDIKRRYGSAKQGNVTLDQVIQIDDPNHGEIKISRSELNEIINARMVEILKMLEEKLYKSNETQLMHKIVITGGGAQLSGLKTLIEEIFGVKTRLGIPINQYGVSFEYIHPSFSSVLGVVKFLEKSSISKKRYLFEEKKGVVSKIFSWLKENI